MNTKITKQILSILFLVIFIFPNNTYSQTNPAINQQDIYDTIQNNQANGASNYASQGFSNDGLYGCAGGGFGSVGKAHAGGIFVPVSEEAVALNTHMLLYKECILDGVIARVRETMVAFMVKSTFNWVNNGNNGEPAFIINQKDFRLKTSDKVVRQFNEGDRTEVIFDDFRQDVRRSLARGYAQATRKPESAYAHTVPDDKKEEFTTFINGGGQFKWDMFLLAIQPQNNPLGAYSLALNQMLTDIDEKISDEYKELDWGQGYKSHKNCKQIPAGNGAYEEHCEIATPGANIKNIIDYVSLTGHRQTENADEIDELMGSLMSNIHTQILTSVGGLRGITESNGIGYGGGNTYGGGSYIDQIAGDAASRTRTEYTNVGTGVLSSAIATETTYGMSRKSSKDALEATAKQIEDKEKACWDGLIARAKSDSIKEVEQIACAGRQGGDLGGTDANGNCTIRGSAIVEIATSTITYSDLEQAKKDGTGPKEYDIVITARAADKVLIRTLRRNSVNSYTIIGQSISPLLRVVNQSVEDSVKALSVLTNLQASLASSNSPGNTRFVLEQVDQLVASGTLHKEGDTYTATAQHDKITETMKDLYDETVKNWDAGWCKPDNWRDQLK